jgi:hypothetical protein
MWQVVTLLSNLNELSVGKRSYTERVDSQL